MKKVKCQLCNGKGYLEVTHKDEGIIWPKTRKLRAEEIFRVHCPACFGHKFEWKNEKNTK